MTEEKEAADHYAFEVENKVGLKGQGSYILMTENATHKQKTFFIADTKDENRLTRFMKSLTYDQCWSQFNTYTKPKKEKK